MSMTKKRTNQIEEVESLSTANSREGDTRHCGHSGVGGASGTRKLVRFEQGADAD